MNGGSLIDRYINHSCAPNCITEVVTVEKENKIIISSCRRIQRGEEVRHRSSRVHLVKRSLDVPIEMIHNGRYVRWLIHLRLCLSAVL